MDVVFADLTMPLAVDCCANGQPGKDAVIQAVAPVDFADKTGSLQHAGRK